MRQLWQAFFIIMATFGLTACSNSSMNWQALVNDAENAQAAQSQAQASASMPAMPSMPQPNDSTSMPTAPSMPKTPSMPSAPAMPSGASMPPPAKAPSTPAPPASHSTNKNRHCHAVEHRTCRHLGDDSTECKITYTQECD